ncbi:hypothetical protein [Haloactinomyces albus]|uniref:Uncharacterized protein n=1 Tax=Haloactinomyces albus TaxID=1352928 RepID=A0AAE3Z7U8_9ACTN|nr:hypothetical protein [Haloactinomyces albus]MDR7299928.1 hypothetical protein [Haloactinomyces albus]
MNSGEVFEDFPEWIVCLDAWRHGGIACAVGSVGGFLYGLARIMRLRAGWSRYRPEWELSGAEARALSADNLGAWAAFRAVPASRYWSQEVLARLATVGTADLVAWDQCGHAWAVAKVRSDVDDFVDTITRSISRPLRRHPPPG